ncbi:hypothetical protein [Amycolatopsis sp.]|uniref:hypothetical protein n=1 Tax=Amycolatopsis sp. TaxID=37632 RepID=UPI002CDD3810|nr:hypothetical protein [Amycolatopsis sp.]HVV11771.1 hypothetical protein [Amycolatopsis sp.]
MSATIIQYRTRPEAAAENRRLVEAVLREAAQAGGIQYAAFQDGVNFVHIVAQHAEDKLQQLGAFAEFRLDLDARVEPGSRTARKVEVLGLAVQSSFAADSSSRANESEQV